MLRHTTRALGALPSIHPRENHGARGVGRGKPNIHVTSDTTRNPRSSCLTRFPRRLAPRRVPTKATILSAHIPSAPSSANVAAATSGSGRSAYEAACAGAVAVAGARGKGHTRVQVQCANALGATYMAAGVRRIHATAKMKMSESSSVVRAMAEGANAAASTAAPAGKAAADAGSKPPSVRDLRKIFFFNMVPFIAFGFVDNTVLIYAGDAIDNSVGVAFGLSSLAAAAMVRASPLSR